MYDYSWIRALDIVVADRARLRQMVSIISPTR
jgi:hypothetical protein